MTPDNIATTTNLLNFKYSSKFGIYATSSSISARGNTVNFCSRDYNSGTITTRNLLTLRPERQFLRRAWVNTCDTAYF